MSTVKLPEHTQILFFKSGHKKTICRVVEIKESEMTKLITATGTEFIVNRDEVELIQRFVPPKIERKPVVSDKNSF